jgi:hypothetical protein
LWRGVGGEVFLRTNLILNPSPHEKDFEKEKFKSPPLLWRGVGGEVFLCTNLILNPSPHEKDFEKEKFKTSTRSQKVLLKISENP